ncbi:MAG: glycosyltransferase, partial [Desulfobacterota bacterium]|nr:glycosyltransferase [Thermodesulfobacteriota bacterium]
RRRRFDLVHGHWSIPQGFTALLLKKLFHIPCVLSLHGSDVYGLGAPLLRALNSKVILGADACVANSMATANRAHRISGRKDVQIIPMGVDTGFFSNSADRLTREHLKTGQDKIILYAGRLIDVKGVEYLIQAFPAVLEKQSHAKLLIVGSGPRKGDLMSLSEKLHLQEKVLFQDAVSQEELVGYYSMADVFVLPSVMTDEGETEGLGVVLLEAMACGVPVIGTKVGGIPDIIKDGETGLLALEKNPGDLAGKICALLSDEVLRKKIMGKASAFVREEFSWAVIAEHYAGLYSRLDRNLPSAHGVE